MARSAKGWAPTQSVGAISNAGRGSNQQSAYWRDCSSGRITQEIPLPISPEARSKADRPWAVLSPVASSAADRFQEPAAWAYQYSGRAFQQGLEYSSRHLVIEAFHKVRPPHPRMIPQDCGELIALFNLRLAVSLSLFDLFELLPPRAVRNLCGRIR